MPKNNPNHEDNNESEAELRQFKSGRRSLAKTRRPQERRRADGKPRRSANQQLRVRVQWRDMPDARKLAKAAIQIALAEAEARARIENMQDAESTVADAATNEVADD